MHRVRRTKENAADNSTGLYGRRLVGIVLQSARRGFCRLDLVLDGAKDVKRRAGDIRYLLSEPYPATSAIKEITLRFERSGWTQLSKDPLDPVGHGEHLRTWAAAPIAPDQLGKVWIGWFGNEGNLAMVMLMYGEPETPKAVADELEVGDPPLDQRRLVTGHAV